MTAPRDLGGAPAEVMGSTYSNWAAESGVNSASDEAISAGMP